MPKYFTLLGCIFIITFLIGASSCRRCSDSDCLNGGTCESGRCVCPYGYFGYFCELFQGNSQPKGTITFYTNTAIPAACGSYSVTLTNYGNQFISYVTSGTCNAAGAAHFKDIPYGTYNYTVRCSGNSNVISSGSVTLNSACVTQMIHGSTANTATVAFYTSSNTSISTCGSLQVQLGSYGMKSVNGLSVASCTAGNTAVFYNVPYGNYTYSVYCGNNGSLMYSATLNVYNPCVTTEVVATNLSLGQISFYVVTGSSRAGLVPFTVRLSNGGGDAVVSAIINAPPSDCNTSGCANFTVPQGTYSASIISGGNAYPLGDVTVSAGECLKVNL